MPIIRESDYKAPFLLQNNHFQTIYHKFLRLQIPVVYNRKRCNLSDGDFVDLDWIEDNNSQLAILLHGLEGSSDSHYMKGMAYILSKNGWDVVAMNFRGCSGEPNLKFRAYHSGDWNDLDEVVKHCVKKRQYSTIHIIGFSLGGNVALRYAGIKGNTLPPIIKKVVGISVPCDLKTSAYHLSKGVNRIYLKRFIQSMKTKLQYKMVKFPHELTPTNVHQLSDFKMFDDYYTAPAHGFADAHTYWETCSSKSLIPSIVVPTYILTAQDDQFLTPECFPIEACRNNPHVLLELPKHGGHVGFVTFNSENEYWHERKVLEFLSK